MCTVGWTDRHQETDIRFSEMCEERDVFNFVICLKYLQYTDLTLIGPNVAVLDNGVTVVVNCCDVESSSPRCCKRT
jgi:hypothetical protein